MRPSLHPRLVNGPYDDPGLFIGFLFEKRSILFDLGEIACLSSKDVLKTTHIFVSHTHMDHFSGFDRLLRIFLGRNKILSLFGPQGFIKNVEGKLSGYSWNLVNSYENSFSLRITEICPDHMLTRQYSCQNRFLPDASFAEEKPYNPVLVEEPGWMISATILDHGIPCLAFSIKEKFHVNIKKDRVEALGLEVGPWIMSFKQALFSGDDPESVFQVFYPGCSDKKRLYKLGELSKEIAIISPGQKITYITDAIYSKSNIEKMVALAMESDHLFIEAAFLEEHSHLAENKYHLTAWQAGSIAAMAGVRDFTLFHYSPRYTGQEELLLGEARRAYHSFT